MTWLDLKRAALILLSPFLAATAHAADVTVVIKDGNGRAVEDAVVIADVAGRAGPPPARFVINQKDMQFVPYVLIVPVGSTIEFGNLDPFRHHVYSFSAAKKFELKLFGQGEKRPVRFDKPGLVSIGCNIHDSMQAFIRVVDTPSPARLTGPGAWCCGGFPRKCVAFASIIRACARQETRWW